MKPEMKSLPDNSRPVEPNKQLRIKPFFNAAIEWWISQLRRADMQSHVITFGGDAIDVARRDAHQPGQI